jgi:hypothetical protein
MKYLAGQMFKITIIGKVIPISGAEMIYIFNIYQTRDSSHMYSGEESGTDLTILHRHQSETTEIMTCYGERSINENVHCAGSRLSKQTV